MYVRLIYTSKMSESYNTPSRMEEIISYSQKNNKRNNIGGRLFWNQKTREIMQILEGKVTSVNMLYDFIKKDSRHHDVRIVSQNEIGLSDALYDNWQAQQMTESSVFDISYSINDFKMLALIGSGGTSTVMLGEHIRTKKKYAVKMISKRRLSKLTRDRIICERDYLAKFEHPFIQRLKCSFQDPCNLYFVTKFASRGDLYKCVTENTFTPIVAIFYLCEIIAGLAYLHERNILHNDMKLENILIMEDGHIVLADFGISTSSSKDSPLAGTPVYFAPEILLSNTRRKESDIWAVGVMLYEMFNKNIPWQSMSKNKMYKLITESDLPGECVCNDECVKHLLSMMLEHDEKNRSLTNDIKDYLISCRFVPSWEVVECKKLNPPFMPSELIGERTTISNFEIYRHSLEDSPFTNTKSEPLLIEPADVFEHSVNEKPKRVTTQNTTPRVESYHIIHKKQLPNLEPPLVDSKGTLMRSNEPTHPPENRDITP